MTFLSMSRLLLLAILAATCMESANAGLLDNLRDAVEDVTGLDFGGTEGEEEDNTAAEGVHFYTEDKLANVAMMVDFVDTPLYLVALFKWRDQAVYEDGRQSNLTGFDADKLYTQAMFSDIVPGIGGEAKFIANIEKITTVVDDENVDDEEFDQDWDALAVIYFPSGLAFGRMLTNQKFQALSPHKKAGLEYHAIFACELMPGSSMDGASAAEDPVSVVDLVDYRRYANYQQGDTDSARFRSGAGAGQKYYESATPLAMDYGMKTASVFKVKHSLMEGAAGWNEVRINTYPSHAALDTAMADPSIESGMHHLEAGANRAKAFQVSPMFFNSLGGNAQIGYYEACTSESAVEMAATMEYDISSYCPSP